MRRKINASKSVKSPALEIKGNQFTNQEFINWIKQAEAAPTISLVMWSKMVGDNIE